MPDWIGVIVALVPVIALAGGGLGALLTFKIQGRQAGAAALTAEAAHETAAVAGRNAAVQEIAELRQYWTAIVANLSADNAAGRAENATLKSDLAALHLAHKEDIAGLRAKLTESADKQADTDIKLAECEALTAAMLARMATTESKVAEVERGQAHTQSRLGDLEHGHSGASAGEDSRGGRRQQRPQSA